MKEQQVQRTMATCVGILATVALVFGLVASGRAAMITYGTDGVAYLTNGLPVSGQATLVTSKNLITITILNLQAGIKSIDQNITGLAFKLDNGMTSDNLVSSAGLERTVLANRTFVDGAVVSTGWQVSVWDGTMFLETVDSEVDPTHTILGPATGLTYPNARKSIAGNVKNNAFLAGPVTFVISIPGIDATTTVCEAFFDYGVYGECVYLCPTTPVPEPGALLLLFGGIGCLVAGRFARTRPGLRFARRKGVAK